MKVSVIGKDYDFKVNPKDPGAKAKILTTIAKSIKFEGEVQTESVLDEILSIFRKAGCNW